MHDTEKAWKAQQDYCESKNYPLFASKRCYRCNQDIFSENGHRVERLPRGKVRLLFGDDNKVTGISVERAGTDHICGCPFCHASFDD